MTQTESAPWATGSSVTFVNPWMNSVSHSGFGRLSRPVNRRRRRSKHSFGAGQGELKYRTPRLVRLRQQPAAMGVDDRSTDRQPHPRAARLRGVERLENAL